MSVTFGFFNSVNGDRTYNADQMSNYFEGLISNGVYESVGGALQVVASTGMTVNVQSGRMIIGNKWINNDNVLSLTVSAAHATLNRYTAVVVRLDRSARTITITTKDGTPASTPTQVQMTNNGVVTEMCLAQIYVAAGATTITQANITDMRASSQCGWVTGIVDQVDTSTLFDQWQTAYEAYYNAATQAFNDWFATLTQELKINTYIQEYSKRVTGTSSQIGIIDLDMTGYTYSPDDIFFVILNGLVGTPDVDYLLDTRNTPVQLHANLTATSTEQNEVYVRVFKSVIGQKPSV